VFCRGAEMRGLPPAPPRDRGEEVEAGVWWWSRWPEVWGPEVSTEWSEILERELEREGARLSSTSPSSDSAKRILFSAPGQSSAYKDVIHHFSQRLIVFVLEYWIYDDGSDTDSSQDSGSYKKKLWNPIPFLPRKDHTVKTG
jgi:hypothetical protein